MGPVRIVAIVIVLAGVLALVYGGFSYTSKDTAAKIGPVEIKVENENRVNVPVWAGVAAIVVGGLLFVGVPRR